MLRRTSAALTATPEKFTILHSTHPKPKRSGIGRLNKMRSKVSDNVAWYDRGPVEWLPRPVRLTYGQLDELRDWVMRETLHPGENHHHLSPAAIGLHNAAGSGGAGAAGAVAAGASGGAAGSTAAGTSKAFDQIRQLHREWSQHPLLPMLGDVEPKFPLNLFKQNHRAKRRFLVRWHKANTPQQWLWLPRPSTSATAVAAAGGGSADTPSAGAVGPYGGSGGGGAYNAAAIHRARPQDYPEYWRTLAAQQNQRLRAPAPRRHD